MCVFQESLQKIVNTLALKNEEIQNFICCLKQNLQNLEVRCAERGIDPECGRCFGLRSWTKIQPSLLFSGIIIIM